MIGILLTVARIWLARTRMTAGGATGTACSGACCEGAMASGAGGGAGLVALGASVGGRAGGVTSEGAAGGAGASRDLNKKIAAMTTTRATTAAMSFRFFMMQPFSLELKHNRDGRVTTETRLTQNNLCELCVRLTEAPLDNEPTPLQAKGGVQRIQFFVELPITCAATAPSPCRTDRCWCRSTRSR